MKVLNIKVKPNAPETKIISQVGDDLVIAVAAPAEDNKANVELVKFLRRKFGADVRIVRGAASKRKIISIG